MSTTPAPDRCPDCGNLIAAHFDGGTLRGCPSRWRALAYGGLPRISVREWKRGDRAGRPIVCWPDYLDEGGVLGWDPITDTWETVPTEHITWITRRADNRIVQDIKARVELELGEPVRIVWKIAARTRERVQKGDQ